MEPEVNEQHWEAELAECEKQLEQSRKYGNAGDVQWYEERRRWALHKLQGIREVNHGKGTDYPIK